MAGEWRPDPEGRFDYRWHDGGQWTDQVSQGGQVSSVPMGAGGGADAPPPPPPVQQWQPQGEPTAGLSGDLVDGTYAEHDGEAVANQGSKMLRARTTEPVFARQGAMVAYQGNLEFDHQGAGGASKWLKQAVTGEGLPLMRVSGQGEVFLANQAQDVHILHLDGGGLSVNGRNVLAYSSNLESSIERVQGAGMVSGGLYNMTLRGNGWVAITTDGTPVVLDPAEAPTFADTDAVVAWSANLQTSVKSTFKVSALIGRSSGELAQISFQGQGFVIVQPSEGPKVAAQGQQQQQGGGGALGKFLGG